MGSGNNHKDIELNGLPNGFYLARIIIDGNYTITKKVMLLYSSQHLSAANSSAPIKISKSNKDVFINSLVISGSYSVKAKINPPPNTSGNTLNLGKIKVKKLPDPPYTSCPGFPAISYAGKTYNTVQIGTQCWQKENLDVGLMLQGKQEQTNNNIIEKYCYDNDTANCKAYGGLYQWKEAMQYNATEKAQVICPTGWHIPTKAELYDTLNSLVKGDGNKLKRNDQGTGSGKGTNETGFSALLTGYRNNNDGSFWALGGGINVWSSTGNNTDIAYFLPLFNGTSYFYQSGHNIALGTSVRCLKDDGNTGTVPAPPTLSLPPD